MVVGGSCVGSVIPVLLLKVVFLGPLATCNWRPWTLTISDLLYGPLILLMLILVMLCHILVECLLLSHLTPYRGFPLGRAQASLRGLHGRAYCPLGGHARGLVPGPAGRGRRAISCPKV